MPPNNAIPPQDAALIMRSQRLRETINSNGWRDLLLILDAVVDDALDAVDKYAGTDEKETAKLTFIWKTAKAVRANFMATLKSQINEGDQIAMGHRAPQLASSALEAPIPSFTAVIPACDVPQPSGPQPSEASEETQGPSAGARSAHPRSG